VANLPIEELAEPFDGLHLPDTDAPASVRRWMAVMEFDASWQVLYELFGQRPESGRIRDLVFNGDVHDSPFQRL
jgi:hypothetical protein